jgi:mannose-6-phosphate isomerase-like protein (cupin superfamily)
MLEPIRRVVTGVNAEGRSVILSDETVATAGESPFWPGTGVTAIWTSNVAPASNRDEDIPNPVTGFPKRSSGGVSLMIMQIRPESELAALPQEQREQATVPVARTFPEALEIDVSKSYTMHATDTLDYLVVLSGQITVMMDEGEVTLKPFDTLIQRGINHGCVNRGQEVALVAAAVIDAAPLERKRGSSNENPGATAPN